MKLKSIILFSLIYLSSYGLLRAETIKVMVMDSPVEQYHPLLKRVKHINVLDKSPLTPSDFNIHGTHVTGLVIYGPMKDFADTSDELCQEVEVISCQIFSEKDNTDINFFKNQKKCFEYALRNNVKYINISGGGGNYNADEFMYLLKLKENGVKLVVAAGNNGENLNEYPYYPASLQDRLNNIIVVGNVDANGKWQKSSNRADYVVKEMGENILSTAPISAGKFSVLSGTSMATAIYTHKLLKKECGKIDRTKIKTVGKIWAI